MHRWRGVNIGQNAFIGQQCFIDNAYPEYVYIGDNTAINQGTTILTHNNAKSHFKGVIAPMVQPVVIHDYAMIGINSTLLPGTVIGKHAIVSAGSVVINKVPDYTMVQGNPARKIINFKHLLEN